VRVSQQPTRGPPHAPVEEDGRRHGGDRADVGVPDPGDRHREAGDHPGHLEHERGAQHDEHDARLRIHRVDCSRQRAHRRRRGARTAEDEDDVERGGDEERTEALPYLPEVAVVRRKVELWRELGADEEDGAAIGGLSTAADACRKYSDSHEDEYRKVADEKVQQLGVRQSLPEKDGVSSVRRGSWSGHGTHGQMNWTSSSVVNRMS
jgi:hypothetical protein